MAEFLNDDKASGNSKAASVRIGSNTVSGYSAQRRHDLRIGRQPTYVDPGRAPLNRILVEYPGPAEMRGIAIERRAIRETRRAMKSNAAIATAGVITFGSEAAEMFGKLSADQQDAAFRELAEAVASRLQTSLHGLMVHLDEATIHAHFVLSSYDHTGHPLSQTTRPQLLSELQDLTAEVLQRYCPEIERGTRYGDRLAAGADFSDVIHKSVAELHRSLPADLAAKRAEVDQANDDALKAKIRADEMQARVDKLMSKETDLTAKEVKNLAIYEKRLADRNAEVEKTQKAVDEAKAEVNRLNYIAAQAKEAAEKSEAGRQQAEEQARIILDKSAAQVEAALLASEQLAQQKVQAADDQAAEIKRRAVGQAERLSSIAGRAKESAEKAEQDRQKAEAEAASIRAKAVTDAEVTRLESQKQAETEAATIREKAAKDADAVGAAFFALAAQIRAGTIRQDKEGKIISSDNAVLRPGGWPLAETARLVLPIISEAKAAKAAAEKDRTAAAQERKEAAGLFKTVTQLFEKLQNFLKRPDVSRASKMHAEGLSLFKDIRREMNNLKEQASLSPAPEEPIEEPAVSSGRGLDELGR